MLLRELVRRHVPTGRRVAVVADPSLFPDLERACDWRPADEWPDGPAPDVVLVDVGTEQPLADALARWPETRTWLLVHPAAPEELPVGPLLAQARPAGLHLVEALALAGHYRVGVVASRDPQALLGYLNGNEVGTPDAARLAWEWGVSSLVNRAREAAAEASLARVTAERDDLQGRLDAATAQAKEAATALRAAQRETERLRTSVGYVLGQHLVGMKRHPFRSSARLLLDTRRLRGGRKNT